MAQSIWVFKASARLSSDMAVPSGLRCHCLEPLTQVQHPSVCFLNVCTWKEMGTYSLKTWSGRVTVALLFPEWHPLCPGCCSIPIPLFLNEVLTASQHLCWQPCLREQGDKAVGHGNLSALLQARDHLPWEWYLWHWPRNWNRWWSPIAFNYIFKLPDLHLSPVMTASLKTMTVSALKA